MREKCEELRLSGDKKDDKITQLDEDLDLSRYTNQRLRKQLKEDHELSILLRDRDALLLENYEAKITEERTNFLRAVSDRDKALATAADLTVKRLGVEEEMEKWIGISLQEKFILDEIIKLGALREGHSDWVSPLVEDVEMPEISRAMRNKFLPSYLDQPIDNDGDEDEEETYRRLSQEASEFSEALDQSQRLAAAQDPDIIKKTILIQAMWRGFNDRVLKGCRFMPQAHMDLLKKSEYDRSCWPTLNPFTRRDKRRTIKFVNTGTETMYVYWIKDDGSAGPAIETPRATEGLRNSSTNILTQLGHWFLITGDKAIGSRSGHVNGGGTDMKYIYIGPRFVNSSLFDTQSGFTFSNEHWSALSKRLQRGGPPFRQDHLVTQEEIIMKVEFLEKEGAPLMEACETVAGLLRARHPFSIQWIISNAMMGRKLATCECSNCRRKFVQFLAELVLQSRQEHENRQIWASELRDDDDNLDLERAIQLSLEMDAPEKTVGHMTSDVEEETGMGELFAGDYDEYV